MIVRMITEEYRTIQYLTNVIGHREPIFWPLDGEGKWSNPDAADTAARNLVKNDHHDAARVLHVIRNTEFGEPIKSIDNVPSGETA